MKNFLFVITIVVGLTTIAACRKDRTCSCKYSEVTSTVTTPRSAGSSSTTVNTTNGTQEVSYSEVKKVEMTRLIGCNNRTETSSNSYTTSVLTPTVLSAGSFTYTSYTSTPADVTVTQTNDYTCEVK